MTTPPDPYPKTIKSAAELVFFENLLKIPHHLRHIQPNSFFSEKGRHKIGLSLGGSCLQKPCEPQQPRNPRLHGFRQTLKPQGTNGSPSAQQVTLS